LARILIVDGDTTLAEVWRAALEREGHLVTIMTSGLDALRSFHREPPDLLLAELVTPGIGGLALAGRIKLAGGGAKVIVTTGRRSLLDPSIDALTLARRAGANLTLAKPVPLVVLIRSVRELLAETSEDASDAERRLRTLPND
jgi:two-component system cell cycle response regulator CpdR